jgi:HSF-type DNA-binding
MMERKEGESSESGGAATRDASSPQCRKEDDVALLPESHPRAPWPPSANTASATDDSQLSSAAVIDQLEQQIRKHLSEQNQQESGGEEIRRGLQPQHANDPWGSAMPYAYRRDAAWGGAGVGTPGLPYQGVEPPADLRREATAPSKPLFQVPESELPPLAKSYLFPSSLIALPAPNSMEPSNVAELSQRMDPEPSFYQEAGGADAHADGSSEGFLRESTYRSSSDMRPRPLRPYSNLSRPSVTTLADAESGTSAYPGRNYGSSAGSGAALPFPIITIPFRSTMARPPLATETAAPGAFRMPGMAAAAAGAAAASTNNNSLTPVGTGLQWDGPFPTSGKEPTFPMKLFVHYSFLPVLSRRKASLRTCSLCFVLRRHQILASPQFRDCICWNSHGRSWRIIKTQEFERTVIPLFFQHSKYSSFLRQVNGWGFERIVRCHPFRLPKSTTAPHISTTHPTPCRRPAGNRGRSRLVLQQLLPSRQSKVRDGLVHALSSRLRTHPYAQTQTSCTHSPFLSVSRRHHT